MKTHPLTHKHTHTLHAHTQTHTHTSSSYSMIAEPIRLYRSWHKHYRGLSLSSRRAAGLWVWPYVSCLLHTPCGLCELYRVTVSNVILWTLGGKGQSSLKRERQKRREEVIQSHVWSGVWGTAAKRLTKRWVGGTYCMSPQSTAYGLSTRVCTCLCTHRVLYVARKLRGRASLWFF